MLRAGRWFVVAAPLVALLVPLDADAARPFSWLRTRAAHGARAASRETPAPAALEPALPPAAAVPPAAVPPATATLPAATPAQAARNGAPVPRLFLSCPSLCFADYLRQELSYFDLVRDPHLEGVFTLLVVRQPSANGGERFSVSLHRPGSTAPPAAVVTRSFVGAPGATEHALREELLQLIVRTLHAELVGSEHEAAFELRLRPRAPEVLDHVRDPWDFWVVAPEVKGTMEGQSGQYYAELASSLRLWRITEAHKLRFSATHELDVAGFRLEDGSRIGGTYHEWQLRSLHAFSLGKHWAIGSVAEVRGSDYENLDLHIHYGPLVEANIFPYSDNSHRQLRVAYQVGPWINWYSEPTRQGKRREALPYHALSLIADVNQPWGSWQWIGQLNSFLLRPEQYRLSTGITLALRLAEGLAVTLTGEAALVRDQISLRERPISDRELLLDAAQQPTNYTTLFELGISYTFGSVHNTIVNPRFGRVDLQEE